MSANLQEQLSATAQYSSGEIFRSIHRGIEKEGLRITPDGKLSQTPHPAGLGSALTHSLITTDYSEALLEFITPVSTGVQESLDTLQNIHSFVYQQLDGELLWAASMPCIVSGDEGIPVARYGSSNVARMKTVYRYGLGHRYGRLMQAIAGIHYNFSMPAAYWDMAWREAGQPGDITDYISERYLGLIRNFHRYSWLLIYLFGASPAVCASFLRHRDNHGLQPFDPQGRSLYMPYGTALRMGDLGYNSDAQKNLQVCYNSLHNYIETLRSAIMQPHPDYRDIPSGEGGNYQQLSDGLLQIENVSPFHPAGLDARQIRFLDTFLLFCLLQDSPPCDDDEQVMQRTNLEAVVNRGRQPGLVLKTSSGERGMAQWAGELLSGMELVARELDEAHDCADYVLDLQAQQAKVEDPELTPSARILREMREQDLPFFRLAMGYSKRWAEHYRTRVLPQAEKARFEEESKRSLRAQREIESSDDISFERYLDNFFSQYRAL